MGDVGWTTWEELNRVPVDGSVRNYGWPCYEGAGRQPRVRSARSSTSCETSTPRARPTPPYFTYRHADQVVPGDGCARRLVDLRR